MQTQEHHSAAPPKSASPRKPGPSAQRRARERGLLRKAQQGNEEALDTLIHEHYERVFQFGRRVCPTPTDAEDATQHAFFTLSRVVADIRGDACLITWLCTVVKNACSTLARRAQTHYRLRKQRSDDEVATSEQRTPEENAETSRLLSLLTQAVESLDPAHRDVLIMRDLQERTGSEVAQMLGLSTAAMKTRLHRARLALKADLLRRTARGASIESLAI